MAQICVSFGMSGPDDHMCTACCNSCGNCSSNDFIPISTSHPHDEANCNARSQRICNAGAVGLNPGELNPSYGANFDQGNRNVKNTMKKSQLRNIIRESIKELMIKQLQNNLEK